MSTTQSYTTEATLDVIRAKSPAFFKKASDLTIRNRLINALCRKWGVYNMNADLSWVHVWDVLYKLPTVSTWSDSTDIVFSDHQALEQFQISEGAYISTDRMTHIQFEQLKGERTRLVNRYKQKSDNLVKAVRNNFNNQILHGDPASNPRAFSGFDTCLADDGATVAADLVARPDDTYATLGTAPQSSGGNWSTDLTTPPNAVIATDWPEGQGTGDGSSEYDFTSPLLVNDGSSNWASGNTFDANAEEVVRYYCTAQYHRGGHVIDSSAPLTLLMGVRKYRQFLEYFSARNHQFIPIPDAVDLGFPKTLYFEGAWIAQEYDVASEDCYCIQPDMLEFYTSYNDLWRVEGPYYFRPELSHLYSVTQLGNFKLQPKFQGRIKTYAS